MKIAKKIFNIIMVLTIVLTSFMPPFIPKVEAEELTQETQNVDMTKKYILYMYYGSDEAYVANQDDGKKVAIASFDTYASAKEAMNKINSEAYATAGIEEDGVLIDADYALVYMDKPHNQNRSSDIEYTYGIYTTAAAARVGGETLSKLTYVAGTWGVDAAFLEYDPTYKAYKVKISGAIGWVRRDYVSLLPISAFYGTSYNYPTNKPKVKITATDNIILRKGPGTNYQQVCTGCVAVPNNTYEYTPYKTTNDGTYTWYYVKIGNNEGYIASMNKNWVDVVDTLLTDTFYYTTGNTLYHYVHMGLWAYDTSITIGEAPFYYSSAQKKDYYLKNNSTICNHITHNKIINRYLSFDSNYFYTNYKDMIDDYRSGEYKKSLNYENPYYAYFMYVPSRVKSNVSAYEIDLVVSSAGYTSNLINPASYYYDSSGNKLNNLVNESILYGTGEAFVKIANRYGANPLAIFYSAWRETGNGTSAIAVVKNNLFGMGANDGNAWQDAYVYNSIEESIEDHVRSVAGEGGYTNISDRRYYGTNKGNKSSGINVYYMSDPYGGEKDSGSIYNADKAQALSLAYSNTLGIKNNNSLVKIYSEPDSTSRVIYETKNYYTGIILSNLSFIVVDKVYTYESGKQQGYYKVHTDVSLNSNREVDSAALYNFDYSYGYIKEEDLYVQNNQPVIEVEDVINIKQLESIDLYAGVTASDYEDGDLTSKVVISGDVDINTVGTYKITYTVTDSSQFSASKTINVVVNPTDAPVIATSTLEIAQYKSFDPTTGVTVTDNYEGDITSSLKVVENNVDVTELGEYTVKYKATNSAGVVSEKTRIVRVITNQRPTIEADEVITKYVNDSFDYSEYVTAYDKEDGNITNKLTVEGEVNTQTVGSYTITCTVKDEENQETVKYITVIVEAKPFKEGAGQFQLNNLSYDETTKKVNIMGFLLIKEKDVVNEEISYSIIFENQQNKKLIIKKLSRLLENQPEISAIDGYSRQWAWFKQELDLADIPTGDYKVYIRARSGDYEVKVPLNDIIFNIKASEMLRKFEIDGKGFEFRTNYFNKDLPIQLFVRDEGLIAKKDNPTIDNIFNQVRNISLTGTTLNIFASSYNINVDYGKDKEVERTVLFENIETFKQYLKTDVGSVTDIGSIQLLVPDSYDRTRAWYKTSIDIATLPIGTYSIIVRTKTDTSDDYGELYDMMFSINPISEVVGNKRISITTASDELRFRLELKIEET